MRASPFVRLAVTVLAVALSAVGATPAAAEPSTGRLVGQLTTHDDQPIGDAGVSVYDDVNFEFIDGTRTDADGGFTFGELPAGPVKIRFDHHGHEQWATGQTEYDQATVFAVTAGDTTTVNERLAPLGTLQGRLVNPDGTPVTSAQVQAEPADSDGESGFGSLDEDGRFAIDVRPGDYKVMFQLDAAQQWAHQARDSESAAVFSVAAGQSVTVDDTLLPTGSIGGTLVDAVGLPVAGAGVTMYEDGLTRAETTTDEAGAFAIPGVFAGVYKMQFSPTDGARQWAFGKRSESEASPITVTAGERTVVDERLLAAGTVAGTFRSPGGKGLAGVTVRVSPAGSDGGGDEDSTATTDRHGAFRLTTVLPGRYTVSFTDKTGRTQYAYGKGTQADARVFTVRGGRTTTVNDRQLPAATLRITAQDATSGKKLTTFCAEPVGAGDQDFCTTKSVVVVRNLQPSSYRIDVNPDSPTSLYLPTSLTARTAPGRTTAVTAKLALGGAISTTVVDRATGRPVADTCAATVRPGEGGLGDGEGNCTEADGKIRTTALRPGTYNLFLRPQERFGAQWLTASGGTGDQRAAARITVTAGKVAAAPTGRLDPAGSITGLVTSAVDGKPLTGGDVSYSAWHFGAGPSHGVDIGRNGRYTLDGLGPYAWPLVFTTTAGRQWSGGQGSRFTATPIAVRAGATVTHDEVVATGVPVRGTLTVRSGTIDSGFVMAEEAATGDPIGSAFSQGDGRYAMTVPAGLRIILRYDIELANRAELGGWADCATTRRRAKVVALPATGTTTVDIKAC